MRAQPGAGQVGRSKDVEVAERCDGETEREEKLQMAESKVLIPHLCVSHSKLCFQNSGLILSKKDCLFQIKVLTFKIIVATSFKSPFQK